jgi:hypothetical protein
MVKWHPILAGTDADATWVAISKETRGRFFGGRLEQNP